MTVEYRTGDLFEFDFPAYAHGVNCHGVMGSGIAPLFKQRWPRMYAAYKVACARGLLTLGSVFPWSDQGTPVIYDLATQDKPGRNARLDAVRSTLEIMVEHAEENQVHTVGMPRIGAGVGGLNWADVRDIIEEVCGPSRVHVVVVSLPNA